MGSAFRTVVSAAGVMSACYVLMSVNWIQVLLLFLAACLVGCIYMCQSKSDGIARVPKFRKQSALDSVAKQNSAPANATAITAAQPDYPGTRFCLSFSDSQNFRQFICRDLVTLGF